MLDPVIGHTTDSDLTVLEGEIPRDLDGIYLRNTENPLLPAIGRYHPFDGDGMLHAISFEDGRASYRNRMIATEGLGAEIQAGAPLWAGILESPEKSLRDGWGARTIGGWFGTGADRGMALVFVLTGVVGLAASLVALGSRYYRALSRPFDDEAREAEPQDSVPLGRA